MKNFKNRKHENKKQSSSNDSDKTLNKKKIFSWSKEMSLLITNLEHLTTQELKQKSKQVQVNLY